MNLENVVESTLTQGNYKMIRKICLLPDVHLTEEVPKPYKVAKKFIASRKWDEIVLMGDYMSVDALSAWDMDKKRKMENRRYLQEVHIANRELDFIQKNTRNTTFLEGNHEYRVQAYLDKHPEMEGLMEVPLMLKLEKRGIPYVKMNDLYKVGNLYLTHGLYTNKYHSNKHVQELGCNIAYGHTHKAQSFMMNMKLQEPIMAWGLGTLGETAPDYMKGRPSNWINGFGVVYLNDRTGNFNLYPINIIDNSFIFEGKEYK